MVLRALAEPAAAGGGPPRHAHGPEHRGDIPSARRALEARGHHPPVGGRHRLVGAAPLGAVANGLGLVGHTFCPITLNNG